jgi:hypothetical protein
MGCWGGVTGCVGGRGSAELWAVVGADACVPADEEDLPNEDDTNCWWGKLLVVVMTCVVAFCLVQLVSRKMSPSLVAFACACRLVGSATRTEFPSLVAWACAFRVMEVVWRGLALNVAGPAKANGHVP